MLLQLTKYGDIQCMQHSLTQSSEFQEYKVKLHERTKPKDPYLIEKEEDSEIQLSPPY